MVRSRRIEAARPPRRKCAILAIGTAFAAVLAHFFTLEILGRGPPG
jgi:hypothetical protein